jgi:MOSC domain-containing protein YiiM
MSAIITGIFIAPAAGAPMTSIETAELEAGRGILGDRYHQGVGTYAEKLRSKGTDDWQITLVESEELNLFLRDEGLSLGHGDFRRNIVTAGIRLNPLVGSRFAVAGVEMEGVRLCEPCAYLANLLTDKLMPAMVGRSGLRARILNDGKISVGGHIAV